jgi:acyl-CoA thioesterase
MQPAEIVNAMMQKDEFSKWLGIRVIKTGEGFCRLEMTVRKEMLNGFSIAHGGITYSLADSALAFASNSKGPKSLSIDTSISHIKSVKENEVLTAIAECESETGKMGYYKVKVTSGAQPENTVALFKGIVYKTSGDW